MQPSVDCHYDFFFEKNCDYSCLVAELYWAKLFISDRQWAPFDPPQWEVKLNPSKNVSSLGSLESIAIKRKCHYDFLLAQNCDYSCLVAKKYWANNALTIASECHSIQHIKQFRFTLRKMSLTGRPRPLTGPPSSVQQNPSWPLPGVPTPQKHVKYQENIIGNLKTTIRWSWRPRYRCRSWLASNGNSHSE